MRKVHLHRKYLLFSARRSISKRTIFILTLVGLILTLFFVFRWIDHKATPILLNYAELETRKLASIIINEGISKNITDTFKIDDLFLITKDSSNEIKTIDFNPLTVNRILTEVTNHVQLNLKYLEQGKIESLDISEQSLVNYDREKLGQGVIYEIPSGVIFQNSLLSNLGPKIPVRLNLAGDIVSNINNKVTNYGINNALIEVSVKLEVTLQVLLPFTSKQITLTTVIPLALKLIQGTVPKYYSGGMEGNSPSFTLPLE